MRLLFLYNAAKGAHTFYKLDNRRMLLVLWLQICDTAILQTNHTLNTLASVFLRRIFISLPVRFTHRVLGKSIVALAGA
jgi:hypothetical protein